MKKILATIYLLFFSLALFLGAGLAHAQGIEISTSPASPKVGDKVTITVTVANPPENATAIKLYISDATASNYEAYLKASWTPPSSTDATASYQYTWDTKAAGSNPGNHVINVTMIDSSSYIVLQQTQPIGLTGNDASPSPTTSASSATSGTGDKAGPNLNTGTLGQFTFPKTKVSSFKDLGIKLVYWFVPFLAMWGVVNIVYAGIMYITAGGDAEKTSKAKNLITNVIIGLVIGMCALLIVYTFMQILGGTYPTPTAPVYTANPSSTPTATTSVKPSSSPTSSFSVSPTPTASHKPLPSPLKTR